MQYDTIFKLNFSGFYPSISELYYNCSLRKSIKTTIHSYKLQPANTIGRLVYMGVWWKGMFKKPVYLRRWFIIQEGLRQWQLDWCQTQVFMVVIYRLDIKYIQFIIMRDKWNKSFFFFLCNCNVYSPAPGDGIAPSSLFFSTTEKHIISYAIWLVVVLLC